MNDKLSWLNFVDKTNKCTDKSGIKGRELLFKVRIKKMVKILFLTCLLFAVSSGKFCNRKCSSFQIIKINCKSFIASSMEDNFNNRQMAAGAAGAAGAASIAMPLSSSGIALPAAAGAAGAAGYAILVPLPMLYQTGAAGAFAG